LDRGAIFALGFLALPLHAAEILERITLSPGVHEITFTSQTLGGPHKLALVVPPALEGRADATPVLFLLHGRGRTHRSLVDVPAIRDALRAAPFCTVLPQGDDGWYIDSPVRSNERYESYLAEVIAFAGSIQSFATRPQQRAIAGWSMGGFGAVSYATRHPAEFGVVVSMIGLLDFPRPMDLPNGRNYTVPVARFGSDPKTWQEFNPLRRAESLRGHAVCLITAEEAFDRVMNENFRARLEELGIAHEFILLPGAHTFDVVQAAVLHVIRFVAASFTAKSDTQPPAKPRQRE
jgi:S-formylglutathione hydrolase FrmB